MKPKNQQELREEEEMQPTEEEFFQLPRAEYMVEDLQGDRSRQIGDLVTNPSQHISGRFTVPVNDNSMQGADIKAGDYVVVKKEDAYPEGCILAVQLGNRQMVRRYSRVAGRIHLQCDPPSRQIIIVEDHTPDFSILGQVVQVIREIK